MALKITLFNKTKTEENLILINNRKAILDNILDSNVEIFYGCMGGSCGACICEILEGEEYIDKQGIRTPIYKNIKEKQFLPCVSKLKQNTPEDAKIIIKKLL